MTTTTNPFAAAVYNGVQTYTIDADDRLRAVKNFSLAQCQAALQVNGLQKTVERAVRARIRKLEQEAASRGCDEKRRLAEAAARTAVAAEKRLELAAGAVTWLLRRMQEDPRLAYLLGFGSESFDRLTAAGAAIAGEDLDPFRERLLGTLQPQPVLGIGKAGAVIETELLARIAAYDDGVHDLDEQDDLNMLVNHFVRRGLETAEAERDTQSGSLF